MAKGDRTGNRKTREQRRTIKVPELGYYLIVTDTQGTERCFFTGLHQSLPEKVRNKLVIKVVETKTRSMIDKCLELTAYEAQYRIPWIVFDRDQVIGFDEIISEADEKMYGKISNAGNEEKAIRIAQQKLEQCEREGKKKPSEMFPGTTVHRLVGVIRGKANG